MDYKDLIFKLFDSEYLRLQMAITRLIQNAEDAGMTEAVERFLKFKEQLIKLRGQL